MRSSKRKVPQRPKALYDTASPSHHLAAYQLPTMFFPAGLLALGIVFLSTFGLYRSVASILNIRIYEEKAEKAADWSNTAKKQLWDTRYTIGAGFISVSPPRPPAQLALGHPGHQEHEH